MLSVHIPLLHHRADKPPHAENMGLAVFRLGNGDDFPLKIYVRPFQFLGLAISEASEQL